MRIVLFAVVLLGLAACDRNAEQTPALPSAAAPPAAAQTPVPSAVTTAVANLAATQGNNVSGTLTLTPDNGGIRVTGTVRGLTADKEFGFHVHEKGDCSAPDASSAGSHFNPTAQEHGDPRGTAHHLGDMPNIKAEAEGTANVDLTIDGATLGSGGQSDVLNKAIVVHAMPDDYKTQPSGNSGGRIACGVIKSSSELASGATSGSPPAP